MKLDRTTYEAWLLDRIEGHLTPEQERELTAFLQANPDLPVALGALPRVEAPDLEFAAKELLHKHFPPQGEPDAARLVDFLIARLEGTLSPRQEHQLDLFLSQHPQALRTARQVAATRIRATAEGFLDKASIARHFPPQGLPDKDRLTDFLIAAQEGDLSAEQQRALASYVEAYPAAELEQRLVQAARIRPEQVVYPDKAGLKKRAGRVVPLWVRMAAAASVLLGLGLAGWLLRSAPDERAVARQEQAVGPRAPVPAEVQPQAVQKVQPATPQAVPPANETVVPAPHSASDGPAKGPRSAPAPVPSGSALPKPAPEPPGPTPVPAPMDVPSPALAQTPPQEQPPAAPNEPLLAAVSPPEKAASPMSDGTALATFVANAVRGEVLDAPQRAAALDGNDAVAAVDKGLHMITGGTGGMQVERTGTRQRVRLQLGRGLAISASRGR